MYHPPKVWYLGGEVVPTTAVSTQMFTFCFFLHYDANTLNVSVYWLIDCRPIILFSMYSDVMQ